MPIEVLAKIHIFQRTMGRAIPIPKQKLGVRADTHVKREEKKSRLLCEGFMFLLHRNPKHYLQHVIYQQTTFEYLSFGCLSLIGALVLVPELFLSQTVAVNLKRKKT